MAGGRITVITGTIAPGRLCMDPRHLEELATLEHSYWWHLDKRQLILSLLSKYFPPPARLLEGGVGRCGNLLAFQHSGYQVSGLDVLPAAIEHGHREGLERLWCHDLLFPKIRQRVQALLNGYVVHKNLLARASTLILSHPRWGIDRAVWERSRSRR